MSQHLPSDSDVVNSSTETSQRRLIIAIVLNLAIVVAQVVVGFTAHSIGLLSDAGHNAGDIIALLVAMMGSIVAARTASTRHSFGFHRASILAAQLNALSMIGVSIWLIVEASQRLSKAGHVNGKLVLITAAIAMVLNFVAAKILHHDAHDLNIGAVVLHLISDAAASGVLVLAGIAIVIDQSLSWTDPIGSIIISLLIAWRAVALLRETMDIFLEAVPRSLDLNLMKERILTLDEVFDVHDLHAWTISSNIYAVSAHVSFAPLLSLEAAQAKTTTIKQLLSTEFGITHITLEAEQDPCASVDDPCI